MKYAWFFAIAGALIALAVSIASYWELCELSCSAQRHYRLFGLKFSLVGVAYFSLASIGIITSIFKKELKRIVLFGLMAGLGSELIFLYYQKFVIGSWCPLCLGIAASLLISTSAMLWITGDSLMKHILPVFVGFIVALLGISRVDALEQGSLKLKQELALGNTDSAIEAYFFTDWGCKACRMLDQRIEDIVEPLKDKSSVFFVDMTLHEMSYNFIPFHLSFLLNEKDKYFELRAILTEMAETVANPSEESVNAAIAKTSVRYQRLDYLRVIRAMHFYEAAAKTFSIQSTPSLVLFNRNSQKQKSFIGTSAIKKDAILKALKELER